MDPTKLGAKQKVGTPAASPALAGRVAPKASFEATLAARTQKKTAAKTPVRSAVQEAIDQSHGGTNPALLEEAEKQLGLQLARSILQNPQPAPLNVDPPEDPASEEDDG